MEEENEKAKRSI